MSSTGTPTRIPVTSVNTLPPVQTPYDLTRNSLNIYKAVCVVVVVVNHVTIVAIGHGLLKKFWPLVIGCVLCTAGSYII